MAQHLEEDDASSVFAILLPPGFPMEEGAQLWKGVRLGKLLGAGAQVRAGGRAARAPPALGSGRRGVAPAAAPVQLPPHIQPNAAACLARRSLVTGALPAACRLLLG